MHARAQILVLIALAMLAAVPFAFAEDKPKPKPPAPKPPPPIEYPKSRASKTWIETPNGTRVAVGEGRSHAGMKVYLSLLWDLVGVDEKSGKAVYAVNVGAFWNAFAFKEITVGGKKTWAVELAPGQNARRGKELRQYHDLRTGKKIVPDGRRAPDLGTALKLRRAWHGAQSQVDVPLHLLVSTQANWTKLRTRMWGAKSPVAFDAVDFDKEIVVLVSSGNSWNCDGITLVSAHESKERMLVRTGRRTYQTSGGGNKTRPWGVFVLPRRAGTHYVLQRNAQNLIGGPPLWRVSWRGRIGDPSTELKGLPAPAKTAHGGWER